MCAKRSNSCMEDWTNIIALFDGHETYMFNAVCMLRKQENLGCLEAILLFIHEKKPRYLVIVLTKWTLLFIYILSFV